jgi:Zn-finger nucleic acid-binding protein
VPPRRPQATAASKAKADRIAAALAGLLEDVPAAPEYSGNDPYRGAELPPKPAARAVELACPNCRGAMEIADERGVEIHRCTSCWGLWLDPGELDELVTAPLDPQPDVAALREEMRKVAPPVGEVRYRMCPRCREPMNRRNYGSVSGVVIDECSRHGSYLDAQEFDAIETFIRMGGLALQRQRFEERIREQQRQARSAAADDAAVLRHRYAYHRRSMLADLFDLFGSS